MQEKERMGGDNGTGFSFLRCRGAPPRHYCVFFGPIYDAGSSPREQRGQHRELARTCSEESGFGSCVEISRRTCGAAYLVYAEYTLRNQLMECTPCMCGGHGANALTKSPP